MEIWRLTVKLVASAGITAFITSALIEDALGKTAVDVVWHATEISLAAVISSAVLSRPFLRAALSGVHVWRSLLIATVGLMLVYPLFAAVHSLLTDGARSISELTRAVLAVPVFALFSAPVAWPITLMLAWSWHRRLHPRRSEGRHESSLGG
jgi:hypothetical protein